jgi:hypothetical protein
MTDDWVICGETEPEHDEDGEPDYRNIQRKILWTNPYSKNKTLPPESGWVLAVDDWANHKCEPKIVYVYREN